MTMCTVHFNTFYAYHSFEYNIMFKYCYLCILQINKEKGQAVVEFLTPEDASAALSFNSRSFSGSIIKIRRPKDFVEVTVRIVIMTFSSQSIIALLFVVACLILSCSSKR